jgi:hypothetical protein
MSDETTKILDRWAKEAGAPYELPQHPTNKDIIARVELHYLVSLTQQLERQRIVGIIKNELREIKKDSDFWEKWINETLERILNEIESKK